jgi:hypothetical protein
LVSREAARRLLAQARAEGLFGQVLRLCHAVGHDRVGVIAIDGTEIAANAS